MTELSLRVAEHVGVSLMVLVISAVIALPVGVWVGHTGRGAGVIGAVGGAGRAVPTLGLLTLVGLWLGIGLGAPVIALVVLAIPSLVTAAYSGVSGVDEALVDAAVAQGHTPWQVVRGVELPMAAGVIAGGVRNAALQVISTTTLVAYVSDVGLGRYIFTGLATRNYSTMVLGSVAVIAVALLTEAALGYVQRRVTYRDL